MRKKQSIIAVIDDDEEVREAIMELMRSHGLAAEAFSSGEEFLGSRQTGRTACVIADFNMIGMSGLDVHYHLLERGKAIPTILITAYPNDEVRARALSAGVICYLIKPFSEEHLIDCVRSGLAHDADGGRQP